MSKFASAYYPPRARWYAPLWKLGGSLRRHFGLSRARLPMTMSFCAFALSLLVPGMGFYLRSERRWGKAALAASGLLLAVFFVWLGYPAGNVAFGLLLSLHSTSIVYLCEPLLVDVRLRTRVFFSMAVLAVVGGLIYLPLRSLIQERCFIPMNVNGRIVVVRAYDSPASVRRGDWIAYSLKDAGVNGIYVRAGYGLGPVLATAGERLRFGSSALEVNGFRSARKAFMPESGELAVAENHWFVWPEVDISGHGNVGEAAISATLLKMSMITKDQFVGKPFKRWFGRRQITP